MSGRRRKAYATLPADKKEEMLKRRCLKYPEARQAAKVPHSIERNVDACAFEIGESSRPRGSSGLLENEGESSEPPWTLFAYALFTMGTFA